MSSSFDAIVTAWPAMPSAHATLTDRNAVLKLNVESDRLVRNGLQSSKLHWPRRPGDIGPPEPAVPGRPPRPGLPVPPTPTVPPAPVEPASPTEPDPALPVVPPLPVMV